MRLATFLLAGVAITAAIVNGLAIQKRTTAVTVYTLPSLLGTSTTLPSTSSCANLDDAWDEKIRSLVTVAGYRCDFYVNLDCKIVEDGDVLRYGWTRADMLPVRFDAKIRSVECGPY
ncbi:hypothetical protein BU16DRAFT_620061 [Lophium mytilinum]|uniref:Uncharacterized protein n=1 Tax=Lophium mytilinum TaxID=390894 RepID=A0A6A6QL13_9PEZI|nr:hypothetical protein BU16DRAFT_620061 [Lophium mytilinum]